MMLFRALLAWVYTAVHWTLFMLIQTVTFRGLGDRWMVSWIRFWGWTILSILGIELEVMNDSTISEREARVIVVNHQSALDLVWPAALASPAPIAIGKKEVIFVPFVNLAWWALDFVRIDRKNHVKALKALEGVASKLNREKRSLYVAPEGTRSYDGSILPLKKGAFHIAQEAGVPICPILVDGAYQLLPRNGWLPKRGTMRVKFLEPIPAAEVKAANTPEALNALVTKVHSRMVEGLKEMRADSLTRA